MLLYTISIGAPAGGCRKACVMFQMPDSIDAAMYRNILDASRDACFYPFDAAMLVWIETVRDVRDAHLGILEAQRLAMRFWFPWL